MSVMFIGQAPNRGGETGRPPLSGAPASRLAALAGIQPKQLFQAARTDNLLHEWPGSSGKGDAFPMREARAAAEAYRFPADVTHAVLLGKATAKAFGLDAAYFRWQEVGPGVVACAFPHTSGINRWWNDPANVDLARDFIRSLPLGLR